MYVVNTLTLGCVAVLYQNFLSSINIYVIISIKNSVCDIYSFTQTNRKYSFFLNMHDNILLENIYIYGENYWRNKKLRQKYQYLCPHFII